MGRFKRVLVVLSMILSACVACSVPHLTVQEDVVPSVTQKEEQLDKEFIEEVGLAATFRDVMSLFPNLEGTEVITRVSNDTALASIQCINSIKTCMMSFNVTNMMKAEYIFGRKVTALIIAHELGHAVQMATNSYDETNPKLMELEADAVGGCAVAALGYSKADLKGFVYAYLTESDTHPEPSKRWDAVSKGYDGCKPV